MMVTCSEPLDVIGASLKPELDPSVATWNACWRFVQMFDPPASVPPFSQRVPVAAARPAGAGNRAGLLRQGHRRNHLELLAERELTATAARSCAPRMKTWKPPWRWCGACHPRPARSSAAAPRNTWCRMCSCGARARLGRGDQRRNAAARAAEPVVCEPGRPRHQATPACGAAAGGAPGCSRAWRSGRHADQVARSIVERQGEFLDQARSSCGP